ncbi:MAG: CDC48 family AAA ATPase [Candidatus Diapherotrites archaeon]|nr:CDC48 family AAA ATPase [Candidatus Diapherotrites archaeon]MDZ4256604.1 CDC48 family AAA ATPase [archaeon]
MAVPPAPQAPNATERRPIVLKVQEPSPTHVGRNIVTLDRKSKQLLAITSGDIVEIEGSKKTAAIVWPARTEDEGKDIIRMDNLIRYNAGVNLGEKVSVRPAQFKEAQKVVLAPTQDVHIIASGYERILKKTFIGRPLSRGDNVWITVFGSGFIYRVVETNPRGIVKITDYTQFILKDEPVKGEIEGVPRVAYEDVGGLGNQVHKVREMIELPMRHPELFRKLGIEPPKGVLLHGPPGTGKTLLAKAVANETQAHFISVSAPSIMSKFVGEAEERVRQYFKEADENAPSIIFIDEIDAIAPKREEVVGEVERRVVAQLLSLMDGMEARGNVIIIAATNRVNSIDEALRRPGRFDREIEIGVPDKEGRKEILQIHTRGMPLAKDVDLDHFANITYGFVGADLTALAKEAAMKALRRYLPDFNLQEETIPEEVLERMQVIKADFEDALREIQPSALREVMVEIPNVKWEDIGSLQDVKKELQQAIEWPLKKPSAFTQMGIRPPRGVLLYGPPGTGKTLLAKAIATESQANFISIKGPELISKWIGESEKGIRQVFKKARQVAPVIVFFDEIDAIASIRGMGGDSGVGERMVNQLLTELDGAESLKDVIFIAATNRPDLIDPGLLRPGRIDKIIEVKLPDERARESILQVHLRGVPVAKNVSASELAKRTPGFSGADLSGLIREAALLAMQEEMRRWYIRDAILAYLESAEQEKLTLPELVAHVEKAVEDLSSDSLHDSLLEKFHVKDLSKSHLYSLKENVIKLFDARASSDKPIVTKGHFEDILAKTTSSVAPEAQEAYAEYRKARSPTGFKPNYVG